MLETRITGMDTVAIWGNLQGQSSGLTSPDDFTMLFINLSAERNEL